MSKAFKAVQAALARKEADLDMMDDQLLGMDAQMPMGTMSGDFDELAQKREELETNIRKMRERIELITAWDQLKNGDWSEEVKGLLKDLDIQIANIADGVTGQPVGMDPLAAPAAPAAAVPPVAPAAPAAPVVEPPPAPMVTEAPAVEETAPEPAPEVEEEVTEEIPPTMASAKKTNYGSPSKKAVSSTSTLTKEGTMTQTATKPALKSDIAAQKSASDNRKAKAQTRIAAAWSIARTMLPGAPIEIHAAFAENLLKNSTKVLTAALRQTAVNAYNTKLAEDIKRKHKMELNDLLEEPSVLSGAKKEVESEMKGSAKDASAKTADDRKDAGPQTGTYNDGRGCGGGTHTEPKETDAGNAGNRPVDTVNKSDDSAKELKAAAQKVAHGDNCEGCEKCAAEKIAKIQASVTAKKAGEKCAECKDGKKCAKHASSKKADEFGGPDAPPAEGAAPAADMPPAPEGDAGGAEVPPMGEPGTEAEGQTLQVEEQTQDVKEKAEETEQAIQQLLEVIDGENRAAEEGVAEMAELPGGGGEELKVEDIFDSGNMEDKEGSLANQGDNSVMADGDSIESFFGPSASAELEASLEPQTASITDMFAVEGSDADPMAVLFGSHEAGDVAGFDVLPSFTSETAKHFETDTSRGDDRDSASDHESDIWAEALESIGFEQSGQKRVKQDETNEMQSAPEGKKAAQRPGKKAAYTGPIRATAPNKTASIGDLGEALMGSFFGDEE